MPYSKRAHTFRTAGGNRPAARARSGSHAFVGFGVDRSCLLAFVREHLPEARPASIENGLRHPRLCQLGRTHIANDDVCELLHERRRMLVKVILARIDDLGVDRQCAAFVASTLRDRERGLVTAEVGRGVDLAAVTESCVRIDPRCLAGTIRAFCGRRRTSPPRAAERLSMSSSNMSSNREELRAKARTLLPPRPERRGFSGRNR